MRGMWGTVLTGRLRRPGGVPVWLLVVVLVLGLALGVGGSWLMLRGHGVPVRVVGTVTAVNQQFTALGVRFDDRTYATRYDGESVTVVGDVPWTDAQGSGYSGSRPACLVDAHRQRVAFDVLDVPGTWVRYVVAVHCLS